MRVNHLSGNPAITRLAVELTHLAGNPVWSVSLLAYVEQPYGLIPQSSLKEKSQGGACREGLVSSKKRGESKLGAACLQSYGQCQPIEVRIPGSCETTRDPRLAVV